MELIALSLSVSIGLLAIDAILELAFITNMVAWLHSRAGGSFVIDNGTTQFDLHGKPLHLLLDQGHTSNGAAGTALVLVGIGGALVLFLRHRTTNPRPNGRSPRLVLFAYHTWLASTLLSVLLTLSALIYAFVVTHNTSGQTIDPAVAAALNPTASAVTAGFPSPFAYPLDTWTPETWFDAVLRLPLASSDDSSDIRSQLRLMIGWRWNLVPMFVLGVAVCALAFVDARRWRARAMEGSDFEREKLAS